MKNLIDEFKTFILRGSVVDLAVGVLIGSAFQGLVTSLTDNIISPIIGMFGQTDFSGFVLNIDFFFIHLNLKYGAFLTDIINFVIMAFVIFMIVKIVNKMKSPIKNKNKKEDEKEEVVESDSEVLKEIRDLLKKKK